MKPLAIDLYCGLGGWTDGLLAEGWNVIGRPLCGTFGEQGAARVIAVANMSRQYGASCYLITWNAIRCQPIISEQSYPQGDRDE